jgi:hypothetical protein
MSVTIESKTYVEVCSVEPGRSVTTSSSYSVSIDAHAARILSSIWAYWFGSWHDTQVSRSGHCTYPTYVPSSVACKREPMLPHCSSIASVTVRQHNTKC